MAGGKGCGKGVCVPVWWGEGGHRVLDGEGRGRRTPEGMRRGEKRMGAAQEAE